MTIVLPIHVIRANYLYCTCIFNLDSPAVLFAILPHDRCIGLLVLVPTASHLFAFLAENDETVFEQPSEGAEAGLADGALVWRKRYGAEHRRHEVRHAHERVQLTA